MNSHISLPNTINESGVNLFDNGISNYRIRVRGKMWYWPFIINAVDAAMVNLWKLYCFCRKYDNTTHMSQLDFRLAVVEGLITIQYHCCKNCPSGKQISNAQIHAKRIDGIDHIFDKIENILRCIMCLHETAEHLIAECPVITELRARFLGQSHLDALEYFKIPTKSLIQFIKELELY